MKRMVLSSFGCLIVILLAVSAQGATLSYTDKLGRVVKVSVPVKRAVFFESYELIPALGVWDEVVGVGRWAYENDLIRATRPDIEQSIPSMGTGTDINIEALLLGNLYREKGDLEKAEEAYRSSLKADARWAKAHMGLALLAEARKDWQMALSEWRFFLEKDPQNDLAEQIRERIEKISSALERPEKKAGVKPAKR